MFYAFLRIKLSNKDITPSQFIFLLQLRSNNGISQEELNNKLQLDKGVVARIAKKLEKNGYIQRIINEEDKRAYKLFITNQAKEFFPTMDSLLIEWNEVLLGDEMNEVVYINDILEKIATRTIKKVEAIKNEGK